MGSQNEEEKEANGRRKGSLQKPDGDGKTPGNLAKHLMYLDLI